MTHDVNDPWRTRAMEEFGAQLRELEQRAAVRSRRRRRRIAVGALTAPALAAVIAVLLLTGGGRPGTKGGGRPAVVMGGAEQPTRAATAVNRAASAAAAAGSVRYHATTKVEVRNHGVSSLSATGVIDFSRSSYAATIINSNSMITIDRLATNGTLYAREDRPGATRPGRWIAIPLPTKDLSGATALSGSQALTDPPGLLTAMSIVTEQPHPAGTAVIDGVETTEYRLTTPLAYLLGGGPLPPAVARRQVGLVVWIDVAGRPRRVVETFLGSSGEATLTTQIHFYGYATSVRVTPPVADVLRVAAGSKIPDPIGPAMTSVFLPGLSAFTSPTSPPAGG
jgi:hypothetical protein